MIHLYGLTWRPRCLPEANSAGLLEAARPSFTYKTGFLRSDDSLLPAGAKSLLPKTSCLSLPADILEIILRCTTTMINLY